MWKTIHKQYVHKKIYTWNPSICACEYDGFLDNCTKHKMNKLVITCEDEPRKSNSSSSKSI